MVARQFMEIGVRGSFGGGRGGIFWQYRAAGNKSRGDGGKTRSARELVRVAKPTEFRALVPMIEVPGEEFEVAKDEVTVGLFLLFQKETGYEIDSPLAKAVNKSLKRTPENKPFIYFRLEDAEAFIEWYNKKSKSTCEIPSEDQWQAMHRKVGHELIFRNPEWTTPSSKKRVVVDLGHPYGKASHYADVWALRHPTGRFEINDSRGFNDRPFYNGPAALRLFKRR